MLHSKFGKIRPGAWISAELEMTEPWLMLAFGVLLCVGGVLVRFFSGTPYALLLTLGVNGFVPAPWLTCLFWSISFFVSGSAGGFVLGWRVGGKDGEKYKGMMYFVLLTVLEYCWYPAFFCGGLLFLSGLMSVLILVLSVVTAQCFFRVSSFAGLLSALQCVWICYLLFLNFAVLFHA